jgi:hypothetical protein
LHVYENYFGLYFGVRRLKIGSGVLSKMQKKWPFFDLSKTVILEKIEQLFL